MDAKKVQMIHFTCQNWILTAETDKGWTCQSFVGIDPRQAEPGIIFMIM